MSRDAERRVAIEMLEIKGFAQYGLSYVASLSRWHAMTEKRQLMTEESKKPFL